MTISLSTFIENVALDGVVKTVRHRANVDVVERYFEDPEGFGGYHSVQRSDVYKGADFLAEFGAMPGTRAMFLGIWRVVETRSGAEVPRDHLTKLCSLEDRFLLRIPRISPDKRIPSWVYTLEPTDVLDEYSGRLVID